MDGEVIEPLEHKLIVIDTSTKSLSLSLSWLKFNQASSSKIMCDPDCLSKGLTSDLGFEGVHHSMD